MSPARLYRILHPETTDGAARIFRGVHHAMVGIGIGIMFADSVAPWRRVCGPLLDLGFGLVCAFFCAEYGLRFAAAAGAPGAEHRGAGRARLAWAASPGGLFDLLGVFPALLDPLFGPYRAGFFALVWALKPIRYAAGLKRLGRVLTHSAEALLSVLLGFGIVLVIAASLAYLVERQIQPRAFGSIPAALWWAIATLTTTGYGDVVPQTVVGRILAGIVMVTGILVFALWAGILASGYGEESRRREFLRIWQIVHDVPFFCDVGTAVIAEVAQLLRPRDVPAGAVVFHRGERGERMYFIASGEVEIRLAPQPVRLGVGQFFGELALLTGAPRTATVVAVRPSTLLALDLVDFHELMARRPELARIIRAEAERRLAAPEVPEG
ncbi:MAG TPA: cyclic nucleotide-gated ion channel [Stellaceae bacterium]|nr:cyclic nucleotide-gated ion channel [Stellaceae bacterium]